MSNGSADRPDFSRSGDWGERRTIAERLFPGPSAPWSRTEAERVQRLLGAGRRDVASAASKGAGTLGGGIPDTAGAADTTDLQKTLDDQNELLRAILASSLDTQSDARATAQNSRTFAWAGIAIAFLTLVASVALLVEAISGA